MSFYSNNGYGGGGFMSNVPTAVKNIIIINVVLMLATMFKESMMVTRFALWFPASPYFEWWQPVTYMFMHGGFFHLFFNMYTLFFFGSVLERVWGPKKFLIFYFVTGLGAAAVHMGVQWIEYNNALEAVGLTSTDASLLVDQIAKSVDAGNNMIPAWSSVLFTPTVGASGSIYGILMGYAMLYPDSIMRLMFPPIAMKAKWFVLIFAALELLLGISSTGGGVAHFAHLGGLIFGFILIIYWKKTRQLYGSY
jgi:membrane associated rhomboid family serine protease